MCGGAPPVRHRHRRVYGLGFDGEAATLFSASPDRRLLSWQLDAGRRFVPERHLGPVDPTAAFGRVAPSCRAVAYVSGSTPMKLWVQELASGTIRRPIQTGHPGDDRNLDIAGETTARLPPSGKTGTSGWGTRQTTESGSSFWPVGPIWISVSICGHTPQS